MSEVCRRLLVRGRVQGVGFRYTFRERALRAGVRGWVRNLADGRVEALLQGPASAVDEVLAFARGGPPGARVDACEVVPEAATDLDGFEIAPSAQAAGGALRS